MAAETSPEAPLPVRTVARHLAEWVSRLGRVWVEGQVTEISRRPGSGTVFLVLRDPVADVSLRITCARGVCEAVRPPLADGARVVVHARPELFLARGTLSLTAYEIRPLGVGELLARLERLKAQLAAEGLFAAERKQPLPFLPSVVGLVCGRASAAERDVVETARQRWPSVRFEIREVAVQGPTAVSAVIEAVQDLDRRPEVDVLVVARGGGSLEDLLPFSDESLCRAIAACRTAVVSAIGHEPDVPLLDLVADVRAATPTDAARRVVPDVAEELQRVAMLRGRAERVVTNRLAAEERGFRALVARPCLARPAERIGRLEAECQGLRLRARRCCQATLDRAGDDLAHAGARVRALSPAATLQRGYAVVQRQSDGVVLRDACDVGDGDGLRVRLALGEVAATVTPARAQRRPAASGPAHQPPAPEARQRPAPTMAAP